MAHWELQLEDEAQTARLGAALARGLGPGDLVVLEGDLGAGKTTLVRATARGLGVPEDVPVTSPTFVLVHELPGRLPVVHADLYRLGDPDELVELGLDEHLEGGAVVLIEWAERFLDALGEPTLVVRLALGQGTRRHVRLEGHTPRGEVIVEAVRREWMERPEGEG